jgi:hypothetical protein
VISIAATRILAEAVEADEAAALGERAVAALVAAHHAFDDADAAPGEDYDRAAVQRRLEEIEGHIGALTVSAARCRRHAARCRLRAAWRLARDVHRGAGPSGGEGPGVRPAAPHC